MTWQTVPNGETADAPASVLFEDRIWLFVRGWDGSVWATNCGDDGDWEGWEQIGPPETLASAPTAVVKGGGLYLFGRGPDNTVRMLSRGEFESWS
jgi:hypothetical protein